MKGKFLLITWLTFVGLISCNEQEATPSPTSISVAQETDTAVPPAPSPVNTPTPTIETASTTSPTETATLTHTNPATPTPSPTIWISVDAGTAVPQPGHPINPDNVSHVTQLARWGRGVINDIAISGNGRWLAVGTAIGVYIHDAEDLSITTDHLETAATVEQVAISPDGTAVAVYLIDGRIQLWDVAANQISHEIPLTAMALDFSPSGKFLAVDHSDNNDGGAHIIDAETGEIVQTYPGFPWVQFSPNNQEVVVWKFGMLERYKWPENTLLSSLEPSDGTSAIGNAQYYSDKEFLMSSLPGNADGTTGDLLIHQGPEGNLLYHIDEIDTLPTLQTSACDEPIVFGDPPGHPQPWQLEISSDGTIAAFIYESRGYRGDIVKYSSIRFYRRETGQLLYHFNEGIEDIVMSPDGNTWIAALQNGRLQIRSLNNDSVISSTDDYDSPALHAAVSPNTDLIAVEYLDDVKIFQTENGELLYHYPARRAAFAADGKTLALGYDDGRLEIRRLSDNQLLRTIYAHADMVTAIVYLPNGQLVSTGLDCGLHQWNPEDGRLIKSLEDYLIDSSYTEGEQWAVLIWNLAVVQDTFLVGQFDGSMGVWRIDTGELLSVIDNYNYLSYNAPFDNSIVVPGTTMLVGNVNSVGQFQEHWSGYNRIYAVTFSTDGNLVLSGRDKVFTRDNNYSLGGAITFWLADSGEVIFELLPVTDRVTSLVFAPNGRFFVSATLDGVVRLWGIP